MTQTATGLAMMQTFAEREQEALRRRIAVMSASRAMDELHSHDARRVARNAAERAAYYAVEEYAKQVANGLAELKAWRERQVEAMFAAPPRVPIVVDPGE